MTALPHTLEPPERDYERAAEDYDASDTFDADAMAWAAETLPADVVELAADRYRESDRYATVVQDALEGEVAW